MRAAATLFAKRGFAGVTTDDIGAAAGVSGPALYHHFKSKEAMLTEMLVSVSEHLYVQGCVVVESTPDPQHALDALIRTHVRFAVDFPELITVQRRDLVRLPEPSRNQVRRLQARYVAQWVDVLMGCNRAISQHTARAGVHAVLGLINSTPHASLHDTPGTQELLSSMALGALGALFSGGPSLDP